MNYLARVSAERLEAISKNTGLSVGEIKQRISEGKATLEIIADLKGTEDIINSRTIRVLTDPRVRIGYLKYKVSSLTEYMTAHQETLETMLENSGNANIVRCLCCQALARDEFYSGRKKAEAVEHYRKMRRESQELNN